MKNLIKVVLLMIMIPIMSIQTFGQTGEFNKLDVRTNITLDGVTINTIDDTVKEAKDNSLVNSTGVYNAIADVRSDIMQSNIRAPYYQFINDSTDYFIGDVSNVQTHMNAGGSVSMIVKYRHHKLGIDFGLMTIGQGPGGGSDGMYIGIDDSKGLDCEVSGQGSRRNVVSSYSANELGRWYLGTVVWDAYNYQIKLYLNDKLTATKQIVDATPFSFNGTNGFIGGIGPTTFNADVDIEACMVVLDTISQEEIKNLALNIDVIPRRIVDLLAINIGPDKKTDSWTDRMNGSAWANYGAELMLAPAFYRGDDVLSEAPINGQLYGRRNAGWDIITNYGNPILQYVDVTDTTRWGTLNEPVDASSGLERIEPADFYGTYAYKLKDVPNQTIGLSSISLVPYNASGYGAPNTNSVAIGVWAKTLADRSIAIGKQPFINTTGNSSINISIQGTINGDNGNVIVGTYPRIGNSSSTSVSIGEYAEIHDNVSHSVAIGSSANVGDNNSYSIAIGGYVNPNLTKAVAIGATVATRSNTTFVESFQIESGHALYFGDGTSMTTAAVSGSGNPILANVTVNDTTRWGDSGNVETSVDFDSVNFNTQLDNPTYNEGTVFYDSTKHALSYYTDISDVTVNMGQELLFPVFNTGAPIPNGSVVYPTALGIGLADAYYNEKSRLVGVVTGDIGTDEKGYVTRLGQVGGLNTSMYTVGQTLYLGTDGNFAIAPPDDGGYNIIIGVVDIVDGTEGVITVDINISNLTVEVNNTNGFPEIQRENTTLSVDESTRTFSINHIDVTGFHFYENGFKYEKLGTQSVVFDDIEGEHWFFYENGILKAEYNPTGERKSHIIKYHALVASIYWNATDDVILLDVLDERHGISMSPVTHAYLHNTRGAQWISGYGLGDFVIDNGDVNTHAQYSVSGGIFIDEDIRHEEENISSTTGLPIIYNIGTGQIREDTQTNFSVLNAPAGRLYYNEWNGTSWDLTEVTNNDFVLYHIFGINGISENTVAIMGQNEYASATAARAAAATEINYLQSSLPFAEMIPIGTVIYQTSTNYNNDVQARIIDIDGEPYVDWRTTELSGGSSASSHLNLTNVEYAANGVNHGHINDVAQTIAGNKTFADTVVITTGILFNDSTYQEHASGIKMVSENGNTGFMLSTQDTAFHGPLGDYAKDFSFHNAPSNITGATGWNSTAFGNSTIASSTNTFVANYQTIASGTGSTAFGNNTTSDGYFSFTQGLSTFTRNSGHAVFGQHNDTTSTTAIFTVGVGNSSIDLRNALEIDRGTGEVKIDYFLRLTPATTPSNPSIGTVYMDSSDNTLKCWDGTAWQPLW